MTPHLAQDPDPEESNSCSNEEERSSIGLQQQPRTHYPTNMQSTRHSESSGRTDPSTIPPTTGFHSLSFQHRILPEMSALPKGSRVSIGSATTAPTATTSRVEQEHVPRAQEQIARLTREQADQHLHALGTLREEQKRMTALKKDMAEVEHQNEILRRQLAGIDVRSLRESAAALVAASDEAQALCATVQSMGGVAARLGALRTERDALLPLTREVAVLEGEVGKLRGLQAMTTGLRTEITSLQPRMAVVERLRKQVATLQVEADNAEALQAQVRGWLGCLKCSLSLCLQRMADSECEVSCTTLT